MEGDDCVICQQTQENAEASLHKLECGHAFHPGCIVEWFRRGNQNCPLCNDTTLAAEVGSGYWKRVACIREVRRMRRRKTCPPFLKKTLDQLYEADKRLIEFSKERRAFKRKHREVYAEEASVQKKEWKQKRRVMRLELQALAQTAVRPIYLHE